jgi:hypothetical protein
MKLTAIAEGVPQGGIEFAVPGSNGPFSIGVCVTHPDGSPAVGLSKDDFKVFLVCGMISEVQLESVDRSPFIGGEGYYSLIARPTNVDWSDGYYIFAVVVSDPALNSSVGRALVKFRLDGRKHE